MKNYKTIFWKVMLGFGLVACLLATTYWITYKNLGILKKNINAYAGLSPKNVYRKKISHEVYDIDFYIKQYSVTKKDSLLLKYDSSVVLVGQYMDDLSKIALDNEEYYRNLEKLGYYINNKLEICRERIRLADSYNTQSGLPEIISKISESQKQTLSVTSDADQVTAPVEDKDQPQNQKEAPKEERSNFFSRLFSGKKNKEKPEEQISTLPSPSLSTSAIASIQPPVVTTDVVSASSVKDMLEKAEKKGNVKSTNFFKQTLQLIEKDDYAQDSIRAVFTNLEKLELIESKAGLNKLTDDTASNTSNILTSLVASGILIMLVFLVIVYREVKHNNRLRKELLREKKSTEKLAKAKEEFLANMSHEIRTPMNVIVGFSEQLLKTGLANEQQKLLFNIKRSSNHLITIINEILDYSKMESGGIVLENIAFDVEEVLEEVYESFKNAAEKKGLELSYNIDEQVSKTIVGDSVRLKQILLNLVANAVKFTEKGMIRITCKVAHAESGSQTLLFEVSDTGIGIGAENQLTIFEQFTQADSSVTRKYGGTGLGLTISKKLVELQQGSIAVKSETGKGSVFYFTIPYNLPVDEHMLAQQNAIDPTTGKEKLAGKKVLIVDDDEMNKLLACHILESYEMKIDVADNGALALEKLIKKQYDIILMDLHMPEMGGLEAIAKIRKKGIQTPVIAVTGNVLKGERDKCLAAGMNEYISKPYHEAELMQKIIQLLPTV
ncbi:MAG: multi-sensor hybrid histidine kinase [Bacteroidetes bacterium]|nr:multi-sensor hybrid histidine kinase [Bacteroidota bacterium]